MNGIRMFIKKADDKISKDLLSLANERDLPRWSQGSWVLHSRL